MTRVDPLRDEIRSILIRLDCDPDVIADEIMDVVNEGVTCEWAYRYPNGHVATWIPQLMTEDLARHVVAEHAEMLTVVRRRVTDWEDAPDAET